MQKTEYLDARAGCTSCKCEEILSDTALCRTLLERMLTARKFEEKVLSLFSEGLVHGTIHTAIGEEAACIGTTAALKDGDYVLTTHRGHAQSIGKGCDINAMLSEILARKTGINGGIGGSMHIADPSCGVLGSNGIVGANAPLACGAALTVKKNNIPDRVALAFFGDGASNEGAVHEAMNLAAAWKLPVMFVLINNTYAVSTPLERAVNDTDLTKRALPFGIKAFECDGNDVLTVYETARDARAWCTEKSEPVLIVEHTYRTAGHSKSDENLYRTPEEIALWESRNPIDRFKNVLLAKNILSPAEIADADARTAAAVDSAAEYAKSQPLPDVAAACENVFSSGGQKNG